MSIPNYLDLAGGGVGSLIAASWLNDTFSRRAIFFLGGWVFAIGAAPQLGPRLHIEGFLLTFILGIGGMSIFAKVHETIQKFPLASIARDVARKWTGLPPIPPTQHGGLTGTTKPVPLPKD